ncbi:MAG TPA: SAM-dependent chlorinase/fluorinase [Solirubrobacterales bacterium]|nr:SAM-dependent chlorinase/fluorinase [Solirubrobacterales bacterium]
MIGPRPLSFLTDFGGEDEFAGVCRAVVDRVDPSIRVIDVTHGIAAGDVRRGALALASFVPYSAPAVHLAVVDPGVGTDRRAIAIEAGDHHLVGPDNGLLLLAADRLGGASRAFEISESPYRLSPTHRTFHGRDIFAPVAAELARGLPLEEMGTEIDATGLVRLDLPEARLENDLLTVHVLTVDHYGNLLLDAGPAVILESFLRDGERVSVEIVDRPTVEVPFGAAFGDVRAGYPVLFPDSSGSLSLAVNRGHAASLFGLEPDDELRIRPL